jgi:arylsulfatase A-like enzyme/Tfp pilus assembly protein PilF
LACAKPEPVVTQRPSILLVTLDTTRADAIGAATPEINALAARGLRFTQAYATAPQTLPSHASMLTGLYPAGHGVRENARRLGEQHPLLAERLRAAGYRTGAFVSAFPVARRFGLARGFDIYDDELDPGREERSARATTDRAVAWLREQAGQPVFLWVHYFEPHYPYEPPEEFRARYPNDPYRGEVAAMDQQLGRLSGAFDGAIVVVGDHGESLGEHGEAQHGNLLYQGAMHVPLLLAAPDVAAGVSTSPVSTRRVYHTILDLAGIDGENSLRAETKEVVLGEAMIPFLQFGWQPQVMALEGRQKVILAGPLEVYDVVADPAESRDLASKANLSRDVRAALREYPIPSPQSQAKNDVGEEERRRLASLGYLTSEVKPVVRKDAPRPRDMAHLFEDLDRASGLFAREEYAAAIPLLETILVADPHNLMAALRIAAAHSAMGHEAQALEAFRKAEAIAPDSTDVRNYLALHYARSQEWERATPMLERIVAETPEWLPGIEALAQVRERQDRIPEAVTLLEKAHSLKTPSSGELVHLGELAMSVGQTGTALLAFERARSMDTTTFAHDLELGVLYIAVRRFEDARVALDRVPPAHPGYSMALFKRAQVSVLMGEADRDARIAKARRYADETTRELIKSERLFGVR